MKDGQTSMDIKWINRTSEEKGIAKRNMRHASEEDKVANEKQEREVENQQQQHMV